MRAAVDGLEARGLPGREDEWPYDSDWLTEIHEYGIVALAGV